MVLPIPYARETFKYSHVRRVRGEVSKKWFCQYPTRERLSRCYGGSPGVLSKISSASKAVMCVVNAARREGETVVLLGCVNSYLIACGRLEGWDDGMA